MVKARVGRACRLRRIRRTYLWLTSLGALPKLRTLLCKKQPVVPIGEAGLAPWGSTLSLTKQALSAERAVARGGTRAQINIRFIADRSAVTTSHICFLHSQTSNFAPMTVLHHQCSHNLRTLELLVRVGISSRTDEKRGLSGNLAYDVSSSRKLRS